MLVLFTVCFIYSVIGVIKFHVHLCADEEIRDDIVTFGYVIAQTYTGLSCSTHIKNVQIPLYYISSICILLVNGFRCQLMTNLIILTVANIVCLLCFSINKARGRKQMINYFPSSCFLFIPSGNGLSPISSSMIASKTI